MPETWPSWTSRLPSISPNFSWRKALRWSTPATKTCFAGRTLATEQRARTRRLGVWRSDRHRPVAAHDLTRLQGLIGRFALVEGVVRSVGERRERTYLNFGHDWKQDLTITIPKRTWAILRQRGLSAAALKGKRIRARGMLEEWQGVAMEIAAADVLEVLGHDSTRP